MKRSVDVFTGFRQLFFMPRLDILLMTSLLLAMGTAVFRVLTPYGLPVRPSGLVCDEPVWNAGAVGPGIIRHIFICRNSGCKSLKIVKIGADCGCSKANMMALPYEILEKNTVDVPVQVDLNGTSGDFAKKIVIYCDGPTQQEIQLIVQGKIDRSFSDAPRNAVH